MRIANSDSMSSPFFRAKDPGIASYPGGPRRGQPPNTPLLAHLASYGQ